MFDPSFISLALLSEVTVVKTVRQCTKIIHFYIALEQL